MFRARKLQERGRSSQQRRRPLQHCNSRLVYRELRLKDWKQEVPPLRDALSELRKWNDSFPSSIERMHSKGATLDSKDAALRSRRSALRSKAVVYENMPCCIGCRDCGKECHGCGGMLFPLQARLPWAQACITCLQLCNHPM